MIEIPVYSQDGNEVDTLSVDEQSLGGEVRPALLKQAYVMYHANRRQGSAANRGRGEKVGSTAKLYRQKGTGRARRGNIRTNVLRGGGVAFAKKPKNWRQAMPRKMRRFAVRNALLAKAVDHEIKIIDAFKFEAPKTKAFAEVLDALSIDRTCLLALDPESRNAGLSARNIPEITIIRSDQLNAFDLLSNRYLLIERAALEQFLSQTDSAAGEAGEAA